MPLRQQILGLIVCLGVAFATAAIGAVASVRAAEFYQTLVQPSWAPPAALFGPVWSFLYLCMGVASWLVWRTRDARRGPALAIYLAQLALNALWSWLFFAWQEGRWAFVEILVLWVFIVATIVVFWRIHRCAAALLLPYLLWVSFATGLAYTMWRLNPGVL